MGVQSSTVPTCYIEQDTISALPSSTQLNDEYHAKRPGDWYLFKAVTVPEKIALRSEYILR